MLCVNYFISLSPFVVYIVYLIKNNYAIEFIIFQFGSLFFLPFFSALIAFSTIISLSILLNLLFYKTYRREGYSALLSFAFVIAITFGFVYLFRSSNKDFANIIIMAIGQIVTRIDVFAIFIAFAFCVFLLIVLILEKFYPTLLLMFINSKTKNITYKYKNKRHSQIGCIFRNECSKLIESPAYFFNSVFTIIILIIIACGAAIYSAIAPNTFINIADSFKINIDDIHTYILFLIPFIIA
jgi:hypothetical protein